MSWVATAIIGSAVIGAGGSLLAAGSAAKGSKNAAQLQGYIYDQNRADLAPYREVGGQALNAYARAMGLPGSSSTNAATTYQYPTSGKADRYAVVKAFREFKGRKPTKTELNYYTDRKRADQLYYDVVAPGMNATIDNDSGAVVDDDPYGGFRESPGYQWRLDQGQRGVERNMAARGRYLSGPREKAAIRFGQNYASNEFGDYMNRHAAGAGIGQTATNAGVRAGNVYGANAGNAMIAGGNARASGYMGAANTINNAANNWLRYRTLNGAGT